MSADTRVSAWSEAARETVETYAAQTGGGVAFDIVFEQEIYTTDRLLSLASNLLLGALVVVLVVLLTMGWRAGLIVGSALPLVGAGSMFVILLTGGELHQMSIFGMIIAIGLLVDNAIVMTDHVRRGLVEGLAPAEAVQRAQGDLFWPLFASSLTTVLAFAPILLLPGSAGDFVGWIGGSVITAIILSFLLSQTVIPALAAGFGAQAAKAKGPLATGLSWPWGAKTFHGALGFSLRHPPIGLLAAAAPALIGFALAPSLGQQFFPPVDRNMFDIQVRLPQGTPIDETRRVTQEIDAALHARDEVRRTTWVVGASHPPVYYNLVENQDRSPFFAQGAVTVGTPAQSDRLVRALQREFDARFPAAQIRLREFGQGPPVQSDIEYRLFGRDLGELQTLGEELRMALQADERVLHTRMTSRRGTPKLWLEADEDEVRLAGLSLSDLAGQLDASLEGRRGGSVLEGLADLPVRVRYEGEWRANLTDIASFPVIRPARDRPGASEGSANAPADWTPVEAFGTFDLRPETPSLSRFDSLRTNTVEADTVPDSLPIDVARQVLEEARADGFALPAGYSLEQGGAVEQNSDAVGNLLIYVPALTVVMVGALILVFRSLVNAGILGLVAFQCFGLAMLATWSIGFPISFNTILGTLGLIGIGLNDSIVVLSEIEKDPRARAGDPDAIRSQVSKVMRHIVSTTLTTIGGFLPLLLFVGGDFWPSLAIVLAGGIGGATLLSVVFVPTLYGWLRRSIAQRAATPAIA
jgi:multidrug efflux pump subunit AcrB